MRAKTFLTLGLITGLLFGSLGVADAAKRKPTTKKFYLHYPAEGGTCGTRFMDIVDSPDSGCGFTFQAANEVFVQTGAQEPLTADWMAAKGLPLVLNGSKPITASIGLASFVGTPSAGAAKLHLVLEGTAGGQLITLIDETKEMQLTGQAGQTFDFSVKPPKSANGKKLTSLVAYTTVHGVSNTHGIELDSPAAFISVPTYK